MAKLDVSDEIHAQWVKFYAKHNRIDYPNLKNFTDKKLQSVMSLYDYNKIK